MGNEPIGGTWQNGCHVVSNSAEFRYEPEASEPNVVQPKSPVESSAKGIFMKAVSIGSRIIQEAKHKIDKVETLLGR